MTCSRNWEELGSSRCLAVVSILPVVALFAAGAFFSSGKTMPGCVLIIYNTATVLAPSAVGAIVVVR